MRRTMIALCGVSLAALLLCSGLYVRTGLDPLLSLAITAGTIFYHLTYRLLVGWIINAIFHNHMNADLRWFQLRSFEPSLYRCLGVKHWKGKLPTFLPGTFSLSHHTLEELIGATCQAEVVHELNLPLSFLPLLASRWFGALPVFLITSLLAAVFDTLFVLIQRYNRPRLTRLARRKIKHNDSAPGA